MPHAFVATSDVARFLVLNTPGTHDSYFRDGGEAATHDDFDAAPAAVLRAHRSVGPQARHRDPRAAAVLPTRRDGRRSVADLLLRECASVLPLFAGLTLLALAVLVGAVAIGNGIRDRNQNRRIGVTGSAKARIVSDYVVWDAPLTSQAAAATAAATELTAWTRTVRAFFPEQGVAPGELTVRADLDREPGGVERTEPGHRVPAHA